MIVANHWNDSRITQDLMDAALIGRFARQLVRGQIVHRDAIGFQVVVRNHLGIDGAKLSLHVLMVLVLRFKDDDRQRETQVSWV